MNLKFLKEKSIRLGSAGQKKKSFSLTMRIYVGRISPSTRDGDLDRLFSRYGRVMRIQMKFGFAFVVRIFRGGFLQSISFFFVGRSGSEREIYGGEEKYADDRSKEKGVEEH